MLHYFTNKPTAGENLYYIAGEYRITPTLKLKSRIFFYADTKADAMVLVKEWKAGNIFKGDMRTISNAERLCPGHELNTAAFFDALRALAFQTKNEPTPCE